MTLAAAALPEILRRASAAYGQGRFAEAEGLCRAILAAQPAFFDALHLLAVVAAQRGRNDEALASYDRALAIRPGHAEALNNRGIALKGLKRFDEAVASYDKALAARPDYAKALYNRGIALHAMNRGAEARADFARAAAIDPGYGAARLALCMAELPLLYGTAAEVDERREAYRRRLDDLVVAADDVNLRPGLARAIGSHQPYYLAYQARNDRDLQARYGGLICALAAEKYGTAQIASPASANERIRVGIVSGFFRMHSNWKMRIGGWLNQLDRRRFEIFGYHTAAASDANTKIAVGLCQRFVQGPLSIERWRQIILADAPHVLIYPEIGMDMVVPVLAAQRLAPIQCSSWGHPETSGFPTIDYFLSSALMEPANGDDHYTERLVRLPNLSSYYEPLDLPARAVERERYRLRRGATLFWCGQTAAKYLPHHDEVFVRIAHAAGDCQFVFVAHGGSAHVTDLLRGRLDRAFAAGGLDANDHCVILPRLEMGEYIAAMGLCDVFLDTPGWSGANTSLESLAHDLPIVTLPGQLMRGRHSLAILTIMGIDETIAESLDDYVAIAARLARDASWRAAISDRIAANKHRLYRDRAPIVALEEFLTRVARPG